MRDPDERQPYGPTTLDNLFVALMTKQNIHDLVIAEQRHDLSPRSCCVFLKPNQKIHRLSPLGPAIDKIPGLNQRRISANPSIQFIHQPHASENERKTIEISVHIAHRNDSIGCLLGRCHRRHKAHPKKEKHQSDANSEHDVRGRVTFSLAPFVMQKELSFDGKP